MENIGSLFKENVFEVTNKKVKPPKNIRDRRELVKEFVDRLHNDTKIGHQEEKIRAYNEGRKPKLYPAPTGRLVAVKMAHLNMDELEAFLGRCKEAKHFSKCWWWSLNPKSNDNKDTK